MRLSAVAALILGLAALPGGASAATEPSMPVEDAVQRIVDDALAANLELRARGASVEQRIAALDQARARYLPVLDLAARYSVADGGRTIEFPVGDLLNPVYATLDEMLVANGQPARFPRVRNESIELLRSEEQETALLVEQPLYEPRLGPNVEASRQQLAGSQAELAALRARVIRDARTGYYRWLGTRQSAQVLDATRESADANLKVNQSLYDAGRITRDLVLRAEADLLEIEQQRLFAQSRVRLAQSYVNLLRDAPLGAPLPEAAIDPAAVERARERFVRRVAGRSLDLELLQQLATERRAELASLDAALAASEAQQDLARAAFKPRLAFGAEAGIQGEEYGFGTEDRYVLASVVLRWNLFRGGADQAALREARALTEELRSTRDLATQQVRLDVHEAVENLAVAEASLETAAKRRDAADGAFRIASRKRDLGQLSQAEFIDSRRAQTDGALNLELVRAEYLSRLAELEFAIGDANRLASETR